MASQRLSRRQLAGAAIVLLAATTVVLGIVLTRPGSTGGNSADPALAKTAAKVLPLLNKPSNLLPVSDTSLRSFQAWFYDLRAPFQRATKVVPSTQFIQVVVEDPNTFPPQAPTLTVPGHSAIYVDTASAQKLKGSGQPLYTTLSASAHDYRVLLEPLSPPAVLRSDGMSGMLLVVKQI